MSSTSDSPSPELEARERDKAKASPNAQGAWVRYLLFNAPFALGLVIDVFPDLVKALLVGAILFLAPGFAWVDRRGRDGFVVVFLMVVCSLLASLAAWLLMLPLPGPTSRVGFLLTL